MHCVFLQSFTFFGSFEVFQPKYVLIDVMWQRMFPRQHQGESVISVVSTDVVVATASSCLTTYHSFLYSALSVRILLHTQLIIREHLTIKNWRLVHTARHRYLKLRYRREHVSSPFESTNTHLTLHTSGVPCQLCRPISKSKFSGPLGHIFAADSMGLAAVNLA